LIFGLIVVSLESVIGGVFEGWQGRLDKLRIPNDDGFVYVNKGGGSLRSRKMLGAGGGSSATSPSRSVWRD
jgi:hypothetical protein